MPGEVNVVMPVDEKCERFKLVTESQKIGQGFDQTMDYYKDWVNTYEEVSSFNFFTKIS